MKEKPNSFLNTDICIVERFNILTFIFAGFKSKPSSANVSLVKLKMTSWSNSLFTAIIDVGFACKCLSTVLFAQRWKQKKQILCNKGLTH